MPKHFQLGGDLTVSGTINGVSGSTGPTEPTFSFNDTQQDVRVYYLDSGTYKPPDGDYGDMKTFFANSITTKTTDRLSGTGVSSIAIENNNVYVGGILTEAGDSSVSNIARWDGSAWNQIESSTNIPVVVNGTSFNTTVPNHNETYIWNGSVWVRQKFT